MSKRKRRHLSAEFKARVAMEALQEVKTIQQIAKDNDIAPSQVSDWKKELQSRIPEVFERSNAADGKAAKNEKRAIALERKIGQLIIEKDFLAKKCEQLGIDLSEMP
ncbi:transposase [Akkermansiaceae bacterium]|nr:transposase [Akkermansiaceae bacterium]